MIKCDFCVIPWYDENGKICFSRNIGAERRKIKYENY